MPDTNTNTDEDLDVIGPEIQIKLANSVQLRITGGAEDDLEDVQAVADEQLDAALDGAETVRDLKASLVNDENRNEHGMR